MRLVLGIALIFGLSGCSLFKSAGCDVSTTISDGFSVEVAKQLSCEDVAAVKASFQEKLVKLKVCEKKAEASEAKGMIDAGDLICGGVIESLFTAGATQIEPKWKCTGSGPIPDQLKAELLAICKKAI